MTVQELGPLRWSSDVEGVKVVLDGDESLLVDDVVVRGEHRFGVIPERDGRNAYFGDAAVEVAKRGGRDVVLDFNRAVNLPCAFTDFATCPLPPPENRLPIAVEAGEKIPYERQSR